MFPTPRQHRAPLPIMCSCELPPVKSSKASAQCTLRRFRIVGVRRTTARRPVELQTECTERGSAKASVPNLAQHEKPPAERRKPATKAVNDGNRKAQSPQLQVRAVCGWMASLQRQAHAIAQVLPLYGQVRLPQSHLDIRAQPAKR